MQTLVAPQPVSGAKRDKVDHSNRKKFRKSCVSVTVSKAKNPPRWRFAIATSQTTVCVSCVVYHMSSSDLFVERALLVDDEY